MPQKTGIFGPKIPFLAFFSLVLAHFGPSKGLFGPFLTLFNTKTPFFWEQICGRSLRGMGPPDTKFFGKKYSG